MVVGGINRNVMTAAKVCTHCRGVHDLGDRLTPVRGMQTERQAALPVHTRLQVPLGNDHTGS